MFGKKPGLNPLELRKQLLLAESELNRAQMAGDLAVMKASLHALTDRAKSYDSIASSAAMLVTGLAAFKRCKPTGVDVKPSWFQTFLKGAGLISTIWLAFRSQNAKSAETPEKDT